MPLYRERKCIFVHIPKTGGQSIENILGETTELFGADEDYELAHLTAAIIRYRNPHEFDSYYKFSIVRHPLDRLVSEFTFSRDGLHRPYLPDQFDIDFPEYVKKIAQLPLRDMPHEVANHLYPQSWFLYTSGQLAVDYVGRFENFGESVGHILKTIGISSAEIPHINASKHNHYSEYYDSKTKTIARRMYAEDFKRFNYI